MVTFKKIKINHVDVGERGRGVGWGLGRQRAREGKPRGGKRRLEKGKRKEQRVE